uniref:Sorting and assembly machinery component 50 homolog, like n=1 Tax=Salarias fasciatus TaxID=181472 RepID=A0A672IK26_SALFA
MGTVHAKSLDPLPMHGRDLGMHPDDLLEAPEQAPESKQEILENKDVTRQHSGSGPDQGGPAGYEISEVFHAKNLIDVGAPPPAWQAAPPRIFKEVEVLIDTSEGRSGTPRPVWGVTEIKRLTGSYNTMVGNNEGSMVLGLKLPNMLGRAEKLTFQFSYGTKETSYGLSFFKPQPGHFERNLTLNLYKVTGQFPWSSLKETDRGVSAELNFPLGFTNHTLKWEGVWRELGCLARSASFAVREESGHSLKSALSHTMSIDSRNSAIFPSRGALLRVNQELAGYTGGDASFLKEDLELQFNRRPVCLLWGGGALPHRGRAERATVCRFYLGGPTSVRGFGMYSIGPQSEGVLGGGAAPLHPPPLQAGPGGLRRPLSTHFFLNAGNLCKPQLRYGEGPRAHLQKLAEVHPLVYGAGIVLRLGNIARLELNYCVPMGVQNGDRWVQNGDRGVQREDGGTLLLLLSFLLLLLLLLLCG